MIGTDTPSWLENEAWARREVTSPRPVGGFVFVLGCLFFGLPGAAFLVFSAIPRRDLGSAMIGSLLLALAGGVAYFWLRGLKYGDSICRLKTLPGTLGGRLVAEVECSLPPDPAQPVMISLLNISGSGRSAAVVWRMDQRLEATPIPSAGTGRCIVPIDLHVPRHPGQLPTPARTGGFFSNPVVWRLEVRKKAPGIDFVAYFPVPMIDAGDAAAAAAADQEKSRTG